VYEQVQDDEKQSFTENFILMRKQQEVRSRSAGDQGRHRNNNQEEISNWLNREALECLVQNKQGGGHCRTAAVE